MALLRMKDLTISALEKQKYWETVADNISFDMEEGEILGIVGESGSGKSVTVLSIVGLNNDEIRVDSGSVIFDGEEMLDNTPKDWLNLRGSKISMIFQEPMTSLNPVIKVGAQVEEMLLLHEPDTPAASRRARVIEMFDKVGLHHPEEVYDQYPHRLSGGMQQRVMIAMAMICRPKLLIADEPTTALDATVQEQILDLMRRLNQEYGVSILLISHDLRVIHSICSHVLVMKDGKVVETGPIDDVFYHPQDPYTQRLLAAIPRSTKEDFLARKKGLDRTAPVQLTVEKLKKTFLVQGNRLFGKKERRTVFEDVSFSLRKGEFAGLLGESGCGKSTLCKCISGLEQADEGEIVFHAADQDGRKRKISMVFQNPYNSMNPSKRVAWILGEPLVLSKVPREEREKRVREMIVRVGLTEEYLDDRMDQLSGGERQRVAIGLALMEEPDLVILDEPVSALDVTIQAQILALLKELKQDLGLTFLFVSHDKNVIYEICDRIFQMENGHLHEVKGS
ncbi:MAG: ABC transporter ATP-binding protein [Lachnospiraceae bacterium]|nr:ABC transporter ATP-binding protein [Lachnospiraceae bacterium]